MQSRGQSIREVSYEIKFDKGSLTHAREREREREREKEKERKREREAGLGRVKEQKRGIGQVFGASVEFPRNVTRAKAEIARPWCLEWNEDS